MGLFRKKPRLVLEGYDDADSGDRLLLAQMVGMGADLTQPRHVLHYTYAAERDAAEAIAAALGGDGWDAEVQTSAADDGQWCVLAQRHGHVLSPATVVADRERFTSLAATHAADYDGWEASLR